MRKETKNIVILLSIVLAITVLTNSCKKKQTIPELATATVTSIAATTAEGGGNITSDGGGNIMEIGICWNTSEMPTIDNYKVRDDYGQGLFSLTMTNLTPNTTYFVRAYATNPAGTGYGDQVTFKTTN